METDKEQWERIKKEAAEADAKDEAIANGTYNYHESKEYLDLKQAMGENEKV